ncbi:S1C family serine protease [Pedobacter sp. ASV28]|uniref:S1C family serine protease n=1 Tax=Pedobacter sp. ASV28 TaxID=2795123 RepID=UPI001E530A6F|nr:serine protease [Pedobacter sp. ASV28]
MKMRNDIELEAIIEDYLKGKLTPEEHAAFEQLRNNDQIVDHKVVAHKVFLESMAQYANILQLKERMDAAHAQIDVETLASELRPHPSKLVKLWKNNRSAVAIAASFILLTMVSLYSIQSNNKQAGTFEAMSKDMARIKTTQNSLIRDIKSREANKNSNNNSNNRARFGGTGFAISGNGYIITNYHVVRGADSVYVQNNKGVSYKVTSFYNDPQNDIAILKINDESFHRLPNLPYAIKKGSSSIGEQVFTLGFPKDDVVLGDGYVSSKTGINGDTLAYQVAIPVNPGNSGGPLLDNNGNIVGIINGKENKTDGATFAVKSKYIMEALNAIPQDSLSRRVTYGKRSQLQGLKRNKQVDKIQDFVFMIKVYNNN